MKICRILWILFLMISLGSANLLGQEWLTRQYTAVDGFSSSTVNALTQDQWGRIWLATQSGISVYDAVKWKNYTVSDGLPEGAFPKSRLTDKTVPGPSRSPHDDKSMWAISRKIRMKTGTKRA